METDEEDDSSEDESSESKEDDATYDLADMESLSACGRFCEEEATAQLVQEGAEEEGGMQDCYDDDVMNHA